MTIAIIIGISLFLIYYALCIGFHSGKKVAMLGAENAITRIALEQFVKDTLHQILLNPESALVIKPPKDMKSKDVDELVKALDDLMCEAGRSLKIQIEKP